MYQPGFPHLEGTWQYDLINRQLVFRINQVQTNNTFFRIPLEIDIYYPENVIPLVKKIDITEVNNEFFIPLENEPIKVTLDPNTWLLYQGNFERQK